MTTALDAILASALELTRSISAEDRYQRLVDSVSRVVHSDAVALLRLGPRGLQPIAARGLSPDVLGRTFDPEDQPRLKAILDSDDPVLFAEDDERPDPYDGLVEGEKFDAHVHSCMGCSLRVGDTTVGVLTLDAIEPGRFESVDMRLVAAFAALAAAALQTAELVESLQATAERRTALAQDMVADALRRQGGALLGRSDAMEQVRSEVGVVAQSDLAVLVTGETGTGKELVARMVHARSPRAAQPLVYVNCAALPETIAESELFGHVRGAFTGAVSKRCGKFELADRGTLFLDEVGELPLAIQAKMLRALQFGEIQRVGSEDTLRVDVRVVAATNRDLPTEVREGRFRADLYHRLSMFPIHVPPLRERPDDVGLLAGHFLDRARMKLRTGMIRLHPAAANALESYSWPGNVRELDHVVTRAALRAVGADQRGTGRSVCIEARMLDLGSESLTGSLADGGRTTATHPVVATVGGSGIPFTDLPLREATDAYKRELISIALDDSDGNLAKAARRLGVDRGNLYRTAQRLGLTEADA